MPVIHFERVRFRASTLETPYFAVTPKADSGTVVATESEVTVEIIHDLLNVVATASFSFDASTGNSGTNTGTGAFTGDQAISDTGTVTALVTPTGSEVVSSLVQEGTVTAVATVDGSEQVSGGEMGGDSTFGGTTFGDYV